tara:strand:+ start:621 stop:1256 length:636 start_codon:yes stop_codon:yes gene_type:complete
MEKRMNPFTKFFLILFIIYGALVIAGNAQAQTNTVTSTVTGTNTVSGTTTVDKTPPTASAPGVVINNNDVCKQGLSGAVQTGLVGVATGITITDENCERIKLARSLFGMGMKVAAVSTLCQDARIFDAMIMAGTPCPYKGKIGKAALTAWVANPGDIPDGSSILKKKIREVKREKKKEVKPVVKQKVTGSPKTKLIIGGSPDEDEEFYNDK